MHAVYTKLQSLKTKHSYNTIKPLSTIDGRASPIDAYSLRYLNGEQTKGDCTVEAYVYALQNGARYIESKFGIVWFDLNLTTLYY